MKSFIQTFLIAIFLNTLSFSQRNICENHLNFLKAESYFFNNKKDSAMIFYQKAFIDSTFGTVSHSLNKLSKAIESDDIEFAKKLIRITLCRGLIDTNYYNDFFKSHPKLRLKSIFEIVSPNDYNIIYSNYKSNLNPLYIKVITDLLAFDQSVRKSDDYFNMFSGISSRLTFDALIKLIEDNNNMMMSYRQLGMEGSDALSTLIKHLDLDQLTQISPYIIKAIRNGDFWESEDYLYQLERSSMDRNVLFKLNDSQDSIVVYGSNVKIENTQNLFYSNYGAMDYYINKEIGMIWWPINPKVNIQIVNEVRSKLCLQPLSELFKSKPYIKFITDEEFINYAK